MGRKRIKGKRVQTETYECVDYKCRLYKANDDILLLDIFINNIDKYIIKLSSYIDNIIIYGKYKIYYKYYQEHPELGWDHEKAFEKVDSIKINLNNIFLMLKDYDIYNGDCRKNLISATLIRKGLLKEFTPQIDESKINLKWMSLCKIS